MNLKTCPSASCTGERFFAPIIALLFALCALPSALHAQQENTISNDGTTSSFWSVGYDTSARLGIGLAPGQAISKMLTIRDSGTAGSQTFIDGWMAGSGWMIDVDSTKRYRLTIDDITVRGTLSVYELILNQIRATNGNLLVTSAATVDSVAHDKESFWVEDVTENNTAPFMSNDIIICQGANMAGVTFDGNGNIINNGYLVKRLIYVVSSVSGRRVYVTAAPGAPSQKNIIKKGDVFCRIGNTSNGDRMGIIGLFSDEAYSPYLRVTDSVASWADWADPKSIRVQLGKLTGIYDTSFGGQLEGYGLYANNVYLKGKIIITNPEDFHLNMVWDSLTNKPAYFNAPTGQGLFIGSANMGYYNSVAYPSEPWRTYMDNQGRFYLRGAGIDYLSWNGSTLTIRGDGNALDISANSTISGINSTLNSHGTQITQNTNAIALRAYSTTTDSLRNRITTAEGSITIAEGNITTHGSQIGQLWSTVSIKANITTTDSLRNRLSSAEAGITAHTEDINGLSASLTLYAKKDSLISRINLSPEEIKISGSKIQIDGNVTFASGYDPSTKTTSGQVTNIVGNMITTGYVNALNVTANSVNSGWIYAGNISANQITSGSIDASDVNIINLHANNIVSGTLNAARIAAGSLSGDKITAGTITSDRLNVTSLSAISANLGTVTAGNISGVNISGSIITGGTIQTASSGQRVIIDANNKIKFYNSSGTATGEIYGFSTGGNPIIMIDGWVMLANDVGIFGNTQFLGDISLIKNVSYSWPSAQGSAGTYLKNDGSGNLSWATVSGGGAAWGSITGTLSSQTDLQTALNTKSNTGHTHAGTDITSGTISAARVQYLTNVTSDVQTQLNSKLSSEVDGSTTNEIQTLGTSGNTITLTSGGSVTAPYAATAGSVVWSGVTSKPTTLSGYGITDAASSSHTHTFASLTSKPTTLSGYGITDGLSSSNTYYGSSTQTTYYVANSSGGSPTTRLVSFPVYINGTLHYLLAY
jgi:hypothetical protein